MENGEKIVTDRAATPVTRHVPPVHPLDRVRVGSLVGRVDLSGHWDSAETNAEIAAEFGMPS